MNTGVRIFLFLVLFGLLVKCDKYEITSRPYPRLHTLPITELTADSVTLNAEIFYRGDSKVLDYGFVWALYNDPNINYSSSYVVHENIQSDFFSATVSINFLENVNYYVRAFIETEDYLIYGENVLFVSLGSDSP